jgi:hypothetical protein
MSCCGQKMIIRQEDVENYDPAKPVCDNQADFNEAVRHAIKYSQEQAYKDVPKGAMYVYVIVYLILFIWALMLALQVKGSDRPLHIALAVLFSPVYILSYYLSKWGGGEGATMGMCGSYHY